MAEANPKPHILATMPAKKTALPLRRSDVISAGLALVEEVGIQALSMRLLATRLGVGTMSPYNHVDGKAELIREMVDSVLGTIDAPRRGPWDKRLRRLLLDVVQAFAPYPGLEEAFLHLPTTPQSERLIQMECDVLREGGLGPDEILPAAISLNAYVTGWTILAATHSERETIESPLGSTFRVEYGLDALLFGIGQRMAR